MTVDRDSFRDSMAHLGAAVNIVTTCGPAGRCGFTASAICSLTDDPPTLIVCMNRNSKQNAAFKANAVACVNTLTANQRDLSEIFAGRNGLDMPQRFAAADWTEMATGAAVLKNALVSFDCQIEQTLEIGTHSLFVCRVLALTPCRNEMALMYFKRTFHAVGDLPASNQ
jgi:flavin reductase